MPANPTHAAVSAASLEKNRQTHTVPTEAIYVYREDLDAYLSQLPHSPLALIQYGDASATPAVKFRDSLSIQVELPQLGARELVEVWTSGSPVHRGSYENWQIVKNDQVLFAAMELDDHPDSPIVDAAQQHYQYLFDLIQEQGYPHLLRMWNYFPAMNEEPGGLERYKQFCVGRHRAFEQRDAHFEPSLPAASAIGTQSGHKFVIYFLASRQPGIQVENPRQVSAFCYPPQYGPASPSFSRGMTIKWNDGEQLYLSGTASVVGHETVHEGDMERQLDETLTNIESLCTHAASAHQSAATTENLTGIKVYIRHRQHYAQISSIMNRRFSFAGPILYVLGDICRADLLLEIEGLFNIP